jgi:hypothetical protein
MCQKVDAVGSCCCCCCYSGHRNQTRSDADFPLKPVILLIQRTGEKGNLWRITEYNASLRKVKELLLLLIVVVSFEFIFGQNRHNQPISFQILMQAAKNSPKLLFRKTTIPSSHPHRHPILHFVARGHYGRKIFIYFLSSDATIYQYLFRFWRRQKKIFSPASFLQNNNRIASHPHHPFRCSRTLEKVIYFLSLEKNATINQYYHRRQRSPTINYVHCG